MEYKLILASASPRRHQLMCDAGFKFEVRLKHTEEIWPEGLAVEERTRKINKQSIKRTDLYIWILCCHLL